jgi:hypothetical protein
MLGYGSDPIADLGLWIVDFEFGLFLFVPIRNCLTPQSHIPKDFRQPWIYFKN